MIMTTIADNLQQTLARIAAAARANGVDPQRVRLLAVTKTFGPEAVLAAWQAGQHAFGENYVQEAVEKIAAVDGLLPPGAQRPEWHLIGPLQANKTRLAATHFDWVHSVDRERIAQRLAEQRPAELGPLQVCLQVNIDSGGNKSGVAPEQTLALAQSVLQHPRLVLRGLMTIPEPSDNGADQIAVHRRARALFDDVRAKLGAAAAAMDTLSMGMSADLESAIACGSTLVRVGTAIFGKR